MNIKVLAVEDTPPLRALLQICLARAGYEVSLAADGEEAARLYAAGTYDAVIMDIQMPVLDGFQAATRMRAWEKEQGRAPSPILALTANTDAADLRRCIEAGFTATVRKPFAREDLLSALAREIGGGANASGDAIEVAVDSEFSDLVPRFLDNARADVASMRASLAQGDLAAVAAAAHKLVGAGASFGFAPLSEHARLAEGAAKAADSARAGTALDALASYLSKVKVITS